MTTITWKRSRNGGLISADHRFTIERGQNRTFILFDEAKRNGVGRACKTQGKAKDVAEERAALEAEKVEMCFVVGGQNAWGRGRDLATAKRNWKASGGRGRPEATFIVGFPAGGDEPYIDAMGQLWTDARANTVKL